MKIDTQFKAQTRKMTPHPREKQKLRMTLTGQLHFVSVTLEVSGYFSFNI